MEVTVTHGAPEDRQIVENLMPVFFMDLSPYDDLMIINEYGLPLFIAPGSGLDPSTVRTWDDCRRVNWWVRDTCALYAIRAGGRPAGYAAVLTDPAYLPDNEVDFELLDFYVLPRFRGRGVGRRAAQAIFDNHRGRWAVYELERNLPARRFWQKVLHEYTGGNFENRRGGIEQRFDNSAKAAG